MATIPLAVTNPQINTPQQSLGAFLQNQDTASQIKMRNAQVADFQAQAAIRQKEVDDQNTIQQLMKDPATAAQIAGGDISPLNGKVSPDTAIALSTKIQEQHKLLAANGDAAIARQDAAHKKIAEAVNGIINNTPDDATAASQAQSLIGTLTQDGTLQNANIDPTKIDTTNLTKDKLKAFLNINGQGMAMLDAASKLNAAKTEAQLKQAQGAEAQATADQKNQQTALQKQWSDQLTTDPQAGSKIINSIVGNAPAAPGLQAAMSQAVTLDEKQAVIKAATAYATERAAKLDPTVANFETQKAIREAAGKANAEVGPHVAEAVAKQKALAAASPEMFVDIADPVARRQVENDYLKTTMDAQQQISDAKRLQEFVQAAASGNKAAAAIIPIAELRQIVNRINSTELRAAGTPGNVIDKATGALNGFVNGVPISAEGLSAIKDLSKVQETNTLRNYQSKVGALGNIYSKKIKPADLEGNYNSTKSDQVAGGSPLNGATSGGYTNIHHSAKGDIGLGSDGQWHDIKTGAVLK